jgi:Tfp pilus assembly protein PilO
VTRQRPFWRRRLLPALAALLALNLVTLAAWTLPQGYKQRNAEAQVQAAREELAAAKRSIAQLRERAMAIRSNVADVGRFYAKQAGSQASDLIPTLEAIEAMARAPGLKPGGRSFSRAEVPATTLERVRVTLPLEGTYSQLVGFLKEVETADRFLTIDSVSMRMSAQRGASLQVQLSAYMQAAPGTSRRRGGHARG